MRDHRKLKAFEHADALATEIYKATRAFPREEQFGLTAQMRRAAVSVAANIVEGCARDGQNEFLNFLNMSFGSLREVGYYIGLSHRLGYLPAKLAGMLNDRYEECARVLSGLMRFLRERSTARKAALPQDSRLKSQD